MSLDYYGDAFRWFVGVVENSQGDPLKLGRVQVRIRGVHTENTNDIPMKDLPWAQAIVPSTEAGVSGEGKMPKIHHGAQVVGFFADGENSQVPIIIGSLHRLESGANIDDQTASQSSNANISDISSDADILGNSNGEKIFKFYQQQGFSSQQAAAFVGNFAMESGLEPDNTYRSGLGKLSQDNVTQGQVGEVLDLISGPESGGRYDAVYPGKRRPEILNMTIDELVADQRERGRSTGSSASGRYQYIRTTLSGIVKQMGLDTSKEKFTPRLQDEIVIFHLRRNHGLDRWLSGSMSNEDFLNRLAGTWAGIPNTSGISTHAGVLDNAAGISTKTALSSLDNIRGNGITENKESDDISDIPYGLAGWKGSRKQNLVSFCNNRRLGYSDLVGQLRFSMHEMETNVVNIGEIIITKTQIQASKAVREHYLKKDTEDDNDRLKLTRAAIERYTA